MRFPGFAHARGLGSSTPSPVRTEHRVATRWQPLDGPAYGALPGLGHTLML